MDFVGGGSFRIGEMGEGRQQGRAWDWDGLRMGVGMDGLWTKEIKGALGYHMHLFSWERKPCPFFSAFGQRYTTIKLEWE